MTVFSRSLFSIGLRFLSLRSLGLRFLSLRFLGLRFLDTPFSKPNVDLSCTHTVLQPG